MTNLTYSRKAFTLIEVVIAVAIIIIMVAVAAPMASSYIVERSLYNAAAQVQQHIRACATARNCSQQQQCSAL